MLPHLCTVFHQHLRKSQPNLCNISFQFATRAVFIVIDSIFLFSLCKVPISRFDLKVSLGISASLYVMRNCWWVFVCLRSNNISHLVKINEARNSILSFLSYEIIPPPCQCLFSYHFSLTHTFLAVYPSTLFTMKQMS